MKNEGCAKMFAYYLVELLAQGEREPLNAMQEALSAGKIVAYLAEKYPSVIHERVGDDYFRELENAAKNFALENSYALTDEENGLAVLLCNVIDHLL